MKQPVTTIIERASKLKNAKLTETEEILLGFLSNQRTPLSGDDIFMELRNIGMSVSYPTVYVTLRRLADLGLLKRHKSTSNRKIHYLLKLL